MGFFNFIKSIFDDDDDEEYTRPKRRVKAAAKRQTKAQPEPKQKARVKAKPRRPQEPLPFESHTDIPVMENSSDIFINSKFDYAIPTPEGFGVASAAKEEQILFTNPATTAAFYVLTSKQKTTPDLFIPEVAHNLRAIIRTFFDDAEITEDYYAQHADFFEKKNLSSKYYGTFKSKRVMVLMVSSYFNNNSVVFIIRAPLAYETRTMDACIKSIAAFSFIGLDNQNDMEILDKVLDEIKQDFARTPGAHGALGSLEMLMQLCYQDFLNKKPGSPGQFIEGLMPLLTLNNLMEIHIVDEFSIKEVVSYAQYLNIVNAALQQYIQS